MSYNVEKTRKACAVTDRKGYYDPDTQIVTDDTTIYEIAPECYQCLSEAEKKKYFGDIIFDVGENKKP